MSVEVVGGMEVMGFLWMESCGLDFRVLPFAILSKSVCTVALADFLLLLEWGVGRGWVEVLGASGARSTNLPRGTCGRSARHLSTTWGGHRVSSGLSFVYFYLVFFPVLENRAAPPKCRVGAF